MARRGFRLRLPGLGKLKLNQNQTWLAIAGLGGLGLLAYLAYSGKKTGLGFLDNAAGQFEDLYEDYVGPFPDMPGAAPAPKIQSAPIVPSAGGGGAGRGMSFDDMVFSGAYATDSPMPYTDWWNNDIAEDDRIIVA